MVWRGSGGGRATVADGLRKVTCNKEFPILSCMEEYQCREDQNLSRY